jgi:vancomycin resistance protein YoaR
MNRTYKGKTGRRQSSRSGSNKLLAVVGVLVLVVAVGAGIIYKANQDHNALGPTASVNGTGTAGATSSNTMKGNKFAKGVVIDDIDLGGLTRDEAKKEIEAKQLTYVQSTGVTVTKDSQSWLFKISDATYTFDTDAVIEEAWTQSSTNSAVKLTTTVTVDPSSLETKVRELAKPYTVAAVDATFVKYDQTKPEGQRLVFNADTPGSQVDPDALWASVKKAFDDRTFGSVAMQVVAVPAAITQASLQTNMQLIGEYQSTIKNHSKERLANITLAGGAITGKFILPGETFSMNDTTGARTAAKGYKVAPIDVNGISDDGLGGGVCQVSGTLYNAAMKAGLTAVERNHHSIPSAYLPKGRDATVDYGSKDLKLKNTGSKPVLMVIYYTVSSGKYYEHAEIYGAALPNGVKYDLVTKLVQTIPAITDKVRYQKNSAVDPGKTKTIPAHKGYVVNVYLETTAKDGTKTQKLLYTDRYNADCVVIAYNKNDEKPTPTPSETIAPSDSPIPSEPTPTPEPTAKPTVEPTTPAPTASPEPTT